MKCLVVFLAVVALTSAAPSGFFDDDFFKGFTMPNFPDFTIPQIPQVSCQSLGCPSDANSCSKKTETSKDKKSINTTVKCLKNGVEIDENVTSKPNPDPNSQVSEYEFYGSYGGGDTTINIENNTGNVPDGIETLTK